MDLLLFDNNRIYGNELAYYYNCLAKNLASTAIIGIARVPKISTPRNIAGPNGFCSKQAFEG